VNTGSDPTLLTCPIPANDTALTSVTFILELVEEALINVKSAPAETAASNKESNGKD
jgi:ribosomal protein S2